MKSVKPGRGPSAMGAVGAVLGVVFGIIWTVAAVSMGAPIFFPLFGLVFITIGIVQAIYNFINATGENRYSEYDIVDESEEPDPLNRRFSAASAPQEPAQEAHAGPLRYCPYCGAEVGDGFAFCGKCGKKLPDTL
ncbi:zinc ribbon domain-containing protein [uncultured Oscillibacter sp.]|uniref:zinc ribbon domain-containing protein n=1 Tax=uncultured Oscillibacter sp. TaxID=876091 RepID=UPI00280BEE6B|nr:zinc ribbon domain-containing protein [uncultured Oscillibacter sp.]